MKLKSEPMSAATAATQDQHSSDFCWEWRLCPESAFVASHTDDNLSGACIRPERLDFCMCILAWERKLCEVTVICSKGGLLQLHSHSNITSESCKGVRHHCSQSMTFFANILFLVCCAASWVRLQVQTGQRAVQSLNAQQTWILGAQHGAAAHSDADWRVVAAPPAQVVAVWSLMIHTPSLGIYMMFTVLCAARDM